MTLDYQKVLDQVVEKVIPGEVTQEQRETIERTVIMVTAMNARAVQDVGAMIGYTDVANTIFMAMMGPIVRLPLAKTIAMENLVKMTSRMGNSGSD